MPLRVTIWNEFIHERDVEVVRKIYPEGMHAVWAEALQRQLGDQVSIRIALLDEPEHGLTYDVLEQTDVLTWWGHAAHERVSEEVVLRVQKRVWHGMGLVALHSAHNSKPFKRLMGKRCMLRWAGEAEKETNWVGDSL